MSNFLHVYRRSYVRACIWYANSGFVARDLDADDHAFIEQIRERRSVACGSLAYPTPMPAAYDLIPRPSETNELDYWIDPAAFVNHETHQVEKYVPTLADIERARYRREQRLRDREMAAAELVREQAEWIRQQREKAAAANRRAKEDLEWERARVVEPPPPPVEPPPVEPPPLPFVTNPLWQHRLDGWRHRFTVEPPPDPDHLTVEQIADLLGVGPGNVRTAIRLGQIPALEFQHHGQRYIVSRAALERLVNGEPPAPPPPPPNPIASAFAAKMERRFSRTWTATDKLGAPPSSDWEALAWWPPERPERSQFFLFERRHLFVREDDEQRMLEGVNFAMRIRFVGNRDGMSHYESADGRPIL